MAQLQQQETLVSGSFKKICSKKGKGFGFITRDDGHDDLYVHFSEIKLEGHFKTLKIGDRVIFQVGTGENGRSRAMNVQLLFVRYMSVQQASDLKVADKIDHRDIVGKYIYATVLEKRGTNLKIHYNGWDSKWDVWSDYEMELHRFAIAGSISQRPAHRFTTLKTGDYLDINPKEKHSGWQSGEIQRLDEKSGQIEVKYVHKDRSYMYWTHLDDETEVAEFKSKTQVISKKNEMNNMLLSFGFQPNYISRAFKVYEQNYGYNYCVEVMTEIIIRLQSKDEAKKHSMDGDNVLNDDRDQLENETMKTDESTHNEEEQRCLQNNDDDDGHDDAMYSQQLQVLQNENIRHQERIKEFEQELVSMETKNKVLSEGKEKLEEQIVKLNETLDSLKDYTENIDAMNEEELDALELRLQDRIKMIRKAKDRLIESQFYCIICLQNKKNIVIEGCHHFDLCDKCEQILQQKLCPRCQQSYKNVIKLKI